MPYTTTLKTKRNKYDICFFFNSSHFSLDVRVEEADDAVDGCLGRVGHGGVPGIAPGDPAVDHVGELAELAPVAEGHHAAG